MQYRRANIPGASYFFTVNLAQRNHTLLTDEINLLRNVIKKVKQQHPFHIDAIVILPEHIHAIWTLPEGDNDFAIRWKLIKAGFSRKIPKSEYIEASRQRKGERNIWQRRYWEHLIRDEDDYNHHINYIHYNPVKHGHVVNASDWKYSSIHRFIDNGVVELNWGSTVDYPDISFGEFS